MKFKDIGVIIPVRMGSSRVKNKVLLPFANSNLLEWKITQLKEIISPNNIYVSTESDVLKEIASKNGVQIHHRDPYLADAHKASFAEVITGIVKDIPFKHIAWTPVVTPLMSPQEYKEAFEMYIKEVIENKNYDSLFSATLLKEYLWDETKPLNYKADKTHIISQHLPNIYQVTNALYMMDKENILKKEYLLGNNPYKFVVSKISAIDIDEYEEYEMAVALFDIYKKRLENASSN